MRSLGIDLSTKATGLVILCDDGTKFPKLLLEHTIKTKADQSGIDRNTFICSEIIQTINSFEPDIIVVEGYSLNMRNAASVIPLVELGGLLRFLMHLDGHHWLDPRATELKKFITGKGNCEKDMIMMTVLQRWGHASANNNTADAYGLACMGLAYRGKLPGLTKEMISTVGKLVMVKN